MSAALAKKGYDDNIIPFLINMYLGGELRGHTSHGLASFTSFIDAEPEPHDEPVVIRSSHALYSLDAKGADGNVIGKDLADEAIQRAKDEGVGTVLVRDMESWLRPGAIAEYIAEQGYLSVVVNSGGGNSVAPPGGFDPTVGTNPIAYGIPTDEEPLVVDLATAKRAWGQVRLANKYGTPLPEDTFYDDDGAVTRDAKKAYSVKPFGEHKGFALAQLIEVMTGSLVGVPMMIDSASGSAFGGKLPKRGAVIIAFDPAVMVDPDEFKHHNSELLQAIQNSQALPGEEIRIPGLQAGRLQAGHLQSDNIEIPDELWNELQDL